ncbi:UDP-N-acetylglucosamine diphosphorylase/glucosamine-1-phosphate N-acetyltransferase [Nannocystis exedens]|uniref:UDP-N-acetylglucosamine diphosphorylase/glucosamine-1-phosphate N-acetyltransferase n=1 Tax=Nannocystis exedens TaxID=54 RepID=A0A1I1Z2X2_9BACT|nr:NTP transferase domain-containing protein [Nannocystis exedens]PCC75186.1 bifunctional N-acetylglucosamine-1-phosphate uridyltransferase/glucosamine-1-phosphate acetyltransferase [Nannocystis exedens]SFE26115.1 UDP-N-acetylglucosamine diphosphorylase/glucosamine-1-phosphate N-acetyltransferase [Nannocystis exedens]
MPADPVPASPPIAVVLAAGKGTRMRSDLPKVLHPLAGEPLAVHVLRSARAAGVAGLVVVVGHGAEQVEAALRPVFADLRFVLQSQQLGTGHAVQCALPAIGEHTGPVLILSGDVPLLRPATLAGLVDACATSGAGLALATFEPADPHGYGRIVRDDHGRIQAIVEERDADAATRAIRECNAGVYCASAELLRSELPTLGRANAQGEIYLTDLVARVAGRGVLTLKVPADEVAGVNTPEQLAALAALLAARAD